MDDGYWIDRAQTAEATLNTLRESLQPALDRVKAFKANFGVRERANGEIDIDFDKLIENLGQPASLALRTIIDERYGA